MNLSVKRKWFTDKSTIGELYIESDFFSYTLEDKVRPEGEKVPGQTAIPAGKYKVIIDKSDRFQRLMPHILDVPRFSGIRIHSGNTDVDTEGCLIVGYTKAVNFVGQSKAAFGEFFIRLEAALQNGEVWITYTNEPV